MNIRKSIWSRALCCVLALLLTIGSGPVYASAEETHGQTVQAIPWELEELTAQGAADDAQAVQSPQYQADELVDVIVELETQPVLQAFNRSSVTTLQAYRQSSAGVRLEQRIESQQQSVLTRIGTLLGQDVQPRFRYTTVLNGFAIRVPYGELEAISQLDGVKNAFVAATQELVEPAMDSAVEMGNVVSAWASSYTGAGVTIAIIDTGLDVDHEAFVTDPAGASVTKEKIAQILDGQELTAESSYRGLSADDVYVSAKIPFAFDYADNDTDVTPDAASDLSYVSHGTHVAGIAAGYVADKEGNVTFSGVAPDAQLLILKAFTDNGGGTADSVTIAALEDAVKLGADIINMSLGSDSGFTTNRDQVIAAAYQRVRDAGISLVCAAGNQYDSALMNNSGLNLSLASDIDTGVLASPASYTGSLAVASAENLTAQLPAISAGGRMITYTSTSVALSDIPGDYDYVMIGGTGTAQDYAAAGDVSGKVAVVQRGELNFSDKVRNGEEAGAVAVIVYDNVDGALSNMSVEGVSIPAIFISKSDGAYLQGLTEKTLTVYAQDQSMSNPSGGQMSEFSSLGVTSDLKLKPEITAPGGYIYSTLPEASGSYGSLSGTSMATPYIAGVAALLRQYLAAQQEDISQLQLQELTNQLLMSTAQPLTDPETGSYYTPRLQGNGLVNAGAALSSPAYIHTAASYGSIGRPLMNLGDDVERQGSYTLSFRVTNLGQTSLSYVLDVTALAPAVTEQNGQLYVTNSTVQLDASAENIQTVQVPAGETVTVSYTVTLSAADKQYLEENFENGAYVDGFARLISQDEDGVDLTASFLAFYGDWTEAPILDHGDWYNQPEAAMTFQHSAAGYVPYTRGYALLGQNAFVEEQNYIPENFAISPNGDGYFDTVELQIGLLRNAGKVTYTVTDEKGNVCYSFTSYQNHKTTYSANYGMMVPMTAYEGYAPQPYGGTDASGNVLPDGTRLTYTVQAELEYDGHESHNKNDTWSVPLLIDTTAPELKGMTVQFVEEDGRRYLEGSFEDGYTMMDAAVMGVLVYGSNMYPNSKTRQDLAGDGSSSLDFRFDVTDISGDYLYLMGYDAAYNSVTYLIPTGDTAGLYITERSVLMNIGETKQIAVIDGSQSGAEISWSSDDASVASVSKNGVITALSSGVTMITATAGDQSVSCLVGVRPQTSVTSFSLNVDHLEIPLGSAAELELANVQPQGVVRSVTDAQWSTTDSEVIGLYNNYFFADKVGTATITATIDGVSASCTVEVLPVDEEQELYLCSEEGGEYPFLQSNYITSYQIYLQGKYRNADGEVFDVGEELVWTTSDENILKLSPVGESATDRSAASVCGGTVREDGSILADMVLLEHVGPGLATVTATTQDGSRSRTYTVNVYPDQPLYLYIDPSEVTMPVGSSREITYSFDASGSRDEDNVVFWRSLNEDVAVVEDGVIQALKPGYTMIVGTLTSGYDSYMTVVVNEANKEDLQALVDEALALDMSLYADGDSKEQFLSALDEAQAVLADEAATAEQITAAYQALSSAMAALELAPEPEPEPEDPYPAEEYDDLQLGDNLYTLPASTSGDSVSKSWTATAAGTLTIEVTNLSYYDDFMFEFLGIEWTELPIDRAFSYGWYSLSINGESPTDEDGYYTNTTSLEVQEGDEVTVTLGNYYGYKSRANVNLSLEETAESPYLQLGDNSYTLPASTSGDSVSKTWTATAAGTLTVSVTELYYNDPFMFELVGLEWLELPIDRAFSYGWYSLSVNGEAPVDENGTYTNTTSLEVQEGDEVTVTLGNYYGYKSLANVNLSLEETAESPYLQLGDNSYTLPASTSGDSVSKTWTATAAGTLTVSVTELYYNDPFMFELVGLEWLELPIDRAFSYGWYSLTINGEAPVDENGTYTNTTSLEVQEGDEVTVTLGNYYGYKSLANVNLSLEAAAESPYLQLGDNSYTLPASTSGDSVSKTWTATAAGTLTVSVTELYYNDPFMFELVGLEWLELPIDRAFSYGWYSLTINGEAPVDENGTYTNTTSLEVQEGDEVTVTLGNYYGYKSLANVNLSLEEAAESPYLQLGDNSYTLPASTSGDSVSKTWTATAAGTLTVSVTELYYNDPFMFELVGLEWLELPIDRAFSYGWYSLSVNGEAPVDEDGTYTNTMSLEVQEGDVVTVTLGNYYGYKSLTNVNLSLETEPTHVHTPEHHDRVEPGCDEDGMEEYWYCPDCGGYFTDEDCQNPVDPADLVIPATGHTDADKDGRCDTCGATLSPTTGDLALPALWSAVLFLTAAALVLLLRRRTATRG